jgi:gluconate 2-dehydrogenase alpha chain
MRRRQFITLSTTSLGGVLVYTLAREPVRVHAQEKQPDKLKVPLRFFTEEQAHVVAAAAALIFPSDESGPGANEAGVVLYIDRQLAGPYGRDRFRYTGPPFEAGVPEQGYQGSDSPAQIYREGLKQIRGLHNLRPEEQVAALTRIDGGNVFEGERSEEYPTPPMKMPYLAALFRDASQRLGYHPYPQPAATTSRAYTNPEGISRAGCTYCGYCERFGCMIGAKAQPSNTMLPVLGRRHNFELRTGCRVRRVQTESGKARGVAYVNGDGEEVFQPAGIVFLASWTLNNTRLLLLSEIGAPYDPATQRGTVGRNLTHHVSIPAAMAFFEKPLNRFMGAGAAGIAVNDFDADVFDHGKLDFLRGGSIYTVCYGFRPMANFGVTPASVKQAWGPQWKKAALHYYDRTGRISFYGEHLAYRDNYMDLDPTYKDRHGDPLLRLTLDWRDNERRMAAFMSRKAEQIAKEMGAAEITPFPGLKRYDATRYQTSHIQGGAIMGTDDGNSVVNNYLQHWRFSNLFVLGASAFPQNPSGHPTLTALALTYRTADAVIDRFIKKPGTLA